MIPADFAQPGEILSKQLLITSITPLSRFVSGDRDPRSSSSSSSSSANTPQMMVPDVVPPGPLDQKNSSLVTRRTRPAQAPTHHNGKSFNQTSKQPRYSPRLLRVRGRPSLSVTVTTRFASLSRNVTPSPLPKSIFLGKSRG